MNSINLHQTSPPVRSWAPCTVLSGSGTRGRYYTAQSQEGGYENQTTAQSQEGGYENQTTAQSQEGGYENQTTAQSQEGGYENQTTAQSQEGGYENQTTAQSQEGGYENQTTAQSQEGGYENQTTARSVGEESDPAGLCEVRWSNLVTRALHVKKAGTQMGLVTGHSRGALRQYYKYCFQYYNGDPEASAAQERTSVVLISPQTPPGRWAPASSLDTALSTQCCHTPTLPPAHRNFHGRREPLQTEAGAAVALNDNSGSQRVTAISLSITQRAIQQRNEFNKAHRLLRRHGDQAAGASGIKGFVAPLSAQALPPPFQTLLFDFRRRRRGRTEAAARSARPPGETQPPDASAPPPIDEEDTGHMSAISTSLANLTAINWEGECIHGNQVPACHIKA
ncbi:unnamed protein product [Gadus morhua 'NCC']